MTWVRPLMRRMTGTTRKGTEMSDFKIGDEVVVYRKAIVTGTEIGYAGKINLKLKWEMPLESHDSNGFANIPASIAEYAGVARD